MKRAGWPAFEPYVYGPPGAPECAGLRFIGLSEAAERYAANRASSVSVERRMERLAALVEAGERACYVASRRGFDYRPRDLMTIVRAKLGSRIVQVADTVRKDPRPALIKPTFAPRLKAFS